MTVNSKKLFTHCKSPVLPRKRLETAVTGSLLLLEVADINLKGRLQVQVVVT